ncbi:MULTISPECIES: YccF domain-containing protein [Corynebacterium]|uniref:Membrane protein n=1 Tax=Corynebacterium flavescens TaxID=28028 RepID=A0A1L7CKW0_CORFL|nr:MULTISPECIES: YccF domain-containing protein [Corynebacterium]APT86435.1 membrane protein [Corynebacterium flavescens]KAA8723642.1 YccF domain-containing protein [Corynebacterium flavescens]MDN6100136.1 YccF domain-containing protein [Corynebacterium flavescens]MDN6200273.1 YccF domain-containing protein [Corynebacterium flavescens]MDN6226857.1 YccF domain-containing protein [Corynebacterium flavescens]
MKTILNIIWFVVGGFALAAGYFIFGVVACLLVVTIPAGVASFRMARFALWPFGRTVVQPVGGTGGMSALSNVVWFIFAGVWLAIGHMATALAQAVTIIGLPVALANLKMIPVTCFPFGRKIVTSDSIPAGWEPMIRL